MLLSVVIISWNSRRYLEPCVRSLMPLIGRDDVELIWVDNGSTDGAPELMAALVPDATQILLGENRGVAAARNAGVRQAKGRYILFIDDDTVATAEAIDALIAYMEANPDAGLCAPALVSTDGLLQPSFKQYPGLWVKVSNVVRGLLGREKRAELPAGVIHPCYVIGACQLIRSEMFDEVGLLDEAIFYGPEDADFCIRIAKAGYKVAYLPHVSIVHHWRRITNRRLFSRISRLHFAALMHFYRKHRRLF